MPLFRRHFINERDLFSKQRLDDIVNTSKQQNIKNRREINIKSTTWFLLIGLLLGGIYISIILEMPNSLPLVQKALVTFHSPTRKAQLKEPIQSLVEASYSTVLTLANFILYHYPSLVPPNFPQPSLQGNTDDTQYPQCYLTYNRLYQPWCDYLSELFLQNKVTQENDVCHMHGDVNEEFIDKLQSDIFQFMQKEPQIFYDNSAEKKAGNENLAQDQESQLKNGMRRTKKIGIINFALSQLRTDFLKPKMHLIGLFTGIFFNQGDEWKTYNILKRQYPTPQQYMELDTVILSGSSLSVNDETPQIVGFIETLKTAIKLNPKLKILGICFGHQALAKMFGGKIVQKKLLTGVQRIDFDQKLIHDVPYFRRTQLGQNTFELSQYHKDFVVQIPQNFDIFAQSQTCKIQSLISKNMKYLSFQFHPEYSAEYIRSFQMRLEHYQIFDLKSSYSYTQRGSIKHDSSLWQIRKIIRNFLDWQTPIQNLQ